MRVVTTKDIDAVLDGDGDKRSIAGFDIMRVASLDNYINILIYGEPGSGKTVLAGSADAVNEMSPVLFIDIEGGTLSLNDFYPGVHVVRVNKWRDLLKVYNELEGGNHDYRTVVIDSLTEANKFSMSDIMKNRDDQTLDPDVPRMRDWGKNIEQTRRFVRAFRDLPMNVVFTALSKQDDDNRGRTITRPSLPGKLAGEVPGFMDIVTYMYVKMDRKGSSPKRLLLTGSTDTTIAKDRSNRLPPVVEYPTMEQLYGLIIRGESYAESTEDSGDTEKDEA